MTIPMHHIAQNLFNTPLMIDPGKAQIIAESLGPRVLGREVTVNNFLATGGADGAQMGEIQGQAAQKAGLWGDELLHVTDSGIAVIEIEGSLIHKGSWVGQSSGLMSYEGIAAQLTALEDRLENDSNTIRGAVVEVDSFGGEVAGCFALAKRINRLSQIIPTMAIVNENACSAAYLLASACGSIVMAETGNAGSIGVVMMHVDHSAWLEKEGVVITLLHDGAHKIDGNIYNPLPDSVSARLQSQLAQMRTLFVNTVGQFRGSRFTADAARATEALVYTGPEAVSLRLVDAVADPMEAYAAFAQELNQ